MSSHSCQHVCPAATDPTGRSALWETRGREGAQSLMALSSCAGSPVTWHLLGRPPRSRRRWSLALRARTRLFRWRGDLRVLRQAEQRPDAENAERSGVRFCHCGHCTAEPTTSASPSNWPTASSELEVIGPRHLWPIGRRLRSCKARWVTVRRRLRPIDERSLGPSAWSVTHSDVPTRCAHGLTRPGARVQVRMEA